VRSMRGSRAAYSAIALNRLPPSAGLS
jgi:hypothetical protein